MKYIEHIFNIKLYIISIRKEIKMKILFTFLTYGVNTFGGVEKSIYNLIQGLYKMKVEAVVYTGKMCKKNDTTNHKIYYSDFLLEHFDVSKINEDIVENYTTYNSEIKQELLDIIDIEKPDYILAIDHIWGIIPYVDIFNETTCPIGIVFHMLHEENLIRKTLEFPFSHIFCVSKYVESGIRKFDTKNNDFILLPNCITEDFYKKNKGGRQKNIFCNARMAEGKGVECLVDAFTKILDVYPHCKLYLCNGKFHFMEKIDIKTQIEKINNSLEEEKIVLLPNLEWASISEVLHHMDIVVLPTEMETFGLGALETIASRIPLITTPVGNLPDLLEDSAFFIDELSSEKIIEEIITVFTEEEIVANKTERGYQIAEKYLDANVAADFVSHIIQ